MLLVTKYRRNFPLKSAGPEFYLSVQTGALKMWGSWREYVVGGWRILRDEELHDCY